MKVFAHCFKHVVVAVVVSDSGRITVRAGYDETLPDGEMNSLHGLLDLPHLPSARCTVGTDTLTYPLEMAIEQYARDIRDTYERKPKP